MTTGIELELIVLLVLQTALITTFAKFEVETSTLKKLFKWFLIDAITILLYYFIQHWAVLFPFLAVIPGTIYHFIWCKKNGIHPFKATPRRKYYQLRNWKWEE